MRNEQGSPTSQTPGGDRVMPFWSSRGRAQRAAHVWGNALQPAYLSFATWRERELPDLDAAGYRIGINWTGPRLVGWDFTVPEVLGRFPAP